MRKNIVNKKNRGMGLVEIIIGAAIISVGVLAIVSAYITYTEYALANQREVEASYLLEEGLEVITFMRDGGWTDNIASLDIGTTYYLEWNETSWATSTSPEYVDGLFLRSFNLSNVNRDSSDQISVSGSDDPDTKLVTVSVSYWQGHGTTTKSVSNYITNLNND